MCRHQITAAPRSRNFLQSKGPPDCKAQVSVYKYIPGSPLFVLGEKQNQHKQQQNPNKQTNKEYHQNFCFLFGYRVQWKNILNVKCGSSHKTSRGYLGSGRQARSALPAAASVLAGKRPSWEKTPLDFKSQIDSTTSVHKSMNTFYLKY